MESKLTHRDLYFKILDLKSNKNYKVEALYDFVLCKVDYVKEQSENYQSDLKKKLHIFMNEFDKRWQKCNRTKNRFDTIFETWLNKKFIFSEVSKSLPMSHVGRPKVLFSKACDKTKRHKTQTLRTSNSTEELVYAAQLSLKETGNVDAAKLLKEATSTTPTRALNIQRAYTAFQNVKPVQMYSEEDALALIIDAKLTKSQYTLIRLQAKQRNANIYPAYNKILEAKSQCYPKKDQVLITEISAEATLQSLLNHTVQRIFQSIENLSAYEFKNNTVVLLSKWGLDGSSGLAQYKQKFNDVQSASDSNIFLTSFVPIQIIMYSGESKEVLKEFIWKNPRTSSTKYCRPIHIQFQKETTELIQNEVSNISNQIQNLVSSIVNLGNDGFVSVKHELVLTMIDGKVCNAISDNKSAQKCYICGAGPKDMNNLNTIKQRPIDPSTLSFGLSSLHAWIRFFECLIHVAYRLGFKKWQARGDDQEMLKKKKNEIQTKFRQELGLLIDQPRPGGSGTTNDGNTARRFFSNPDVSSSITGVDKNIIVRFKVILEVISSGEKIKGVEFNNYTFETAQLFISKYPWFYLPASVHKILIHETQIVENAILPIGLLSEEAQEARNKDMKRFRENNTRKISRKHTMEDLFNNLLISSDPLISSRRKISNKKSTRLCDEAKLLVCIVGENKEDFYINEENSEDEFMEYE
ncbi:uncharacterized protein LOC112684234 [Sipha flava]|uniref:Uncharacterized protein LOC112684234 n=1 Tax=Sipha flava TaxID=143950 RepID=A0A8B8FKI2_9HEMI|nr:uncharacterized protein LOC112684234 [Sipha flava]